MPAYATDLTNYVLTLIRLGLSDADRAAAVRALCATSDDDRVLAAAFRDANAAAQRETGVRG